MSFRTEVFYIKEEVDNIGVDLSFKFKTYLAAENYIKTNSWNPVTGIAFHNPVIVKTWESDSPDNFMKDDVHFYEDVWGS